MSKTVFVVNEEKRTLTRTGGEPVFVEGDKFVDSVDILFPDYFEDMDLNTSLVRIMYKTSGASEVRRVALTTFQTDEEGYVSYTWDLGALTDVPGSIAFSVCLLDLAADGQTVEYEWHTTPASFNIVSTIHGESDALVPPDVAADIETQIQALRAEVSAITYKINNFNGGLPTPVSLASEMFDESLLYLYMGNEEGYQHGYWYYYDNSIYEWVAGAQYGAHDSDSELDETSINPIQNRAVATAFNNLRTEVLAAAGRAIENLPAGSIERVKLSSAVEAVLLLAESAMQPSVYDTLGLQTDIFQYAKGRADTVQENLNTVIREIQAAYIINDAGDEYTYNNLHNAMQGLLSLIKAYVQARLVEYKAFTITIIEQLPVAGQAMTFYLVPKAGGGYDKWWWITDANGNGMWDVFGSATTLVVEQLPATGDTDTDYILRTDAGCVYYKWIDGEWVVVAGSMAKVVEELPETGSEIVDYYCPNSAGVYLHYRWIDGDYVVIGADAYTKAEVDAIVSGIGNRIGITEQNISALETRLNALGNLVADVTESNGTVTVTYKDGTSRTFSVRDQNVTVEDINAAEGGIQVLYTDGETKDIAISGGGGSSSTGSASITRVTAASLTSVHGASVPIEYSLTALDSAGDLVGAGTATWYVNGVRKATSIANQGQNSFDIGEYLNVGANAIRLSISVDTGGETPTVTTKTWTVNSVNLYLTWDYDDTTINTADTATIRWTPYGDVSKTTHVVIDGVEDEDLQTVTTRSGVQQYVTFDKLAHGAHTVELYLTATINGTAIRSESVMHDMMFVDTAASTPVIAVSLPSPAEMTQYNTLRIPVAIYDPSALTTNATIAVNGTTIAEWTNIDRTLQYLNFTPSDYGTKTLTITCGETTKTLTINVTQLNIDNAEVGGYAFRLKASDLAGNDALRTWASNGVTAAFSSNFDWNNGGLKSETDENGIARQYICVKAGTTMTIGYELFGNEAKTNGKSVKVIFKTANCRDYDAVWLDCLSDNIGVQLGANNGVARSEQNAVNVQYAEGDYTEFELDIYPDNLQSSAGFPMRYMQTYLDGVLASTNIYAANDNFTQTAKKNIVIGSADCDVYVYMIKVYETYLTRENHITNFIADASNAVEMVERYNRNDVLTQAGEIDYLALSQKCPDVRVHLLDITRMTLNKMKKDPVAGCTYQQIYGSGDESDQVIAENVTIGVQGTSSINYISSAANLDIRCDGGFTDGNGVHTEGYAMTDDSIPVNYFNIKVNVASCENINNMCLAEWYNRFQPYRSGARANVEKARDCMEHNIGVLFIRDRHEDNENEQYALFKDVDPNGDNYHMYAICNMGNSKDNGGVFHDANNPLECCLETKDNNSSICMMTSTITQEDLDSEDYFEFRYPKKPTQAMQTAFMDFVNWAASRNPAAYTGNALAEPVTFEPYTFKGTSSWDTKEQTEILAGLTISDYAGTYTHDTYNYRMARLLSECEDHLVMDSIVYHYVFIEQHAMVDNVCKNTFWGTDDLIHWHLCKNYDNDTADGNNNTGKLTIPFGSEGMDTVAGGDVFNGKMNVYWQLVYGLYEARRRMWQNREAAGAWNADAYLAFATGRQNFIPERVYNQDYWYKYLRPYEQNGDTTYIAMLEGGKKTHQREAFVRNNLTYMASQYMGTYCTSDSITVRAYTPGVSEDMTPAEAAIINATIAAVPPVAAVQVMLYNKGYVVVEVASVMKRLKAEKGVMYTIDFSESSSAMNDTVVNIHGAANVRAIGDMSPLYIKFCNFSKAKRLRSLQIGSLVEGYSNIGLESVGFESNPMLEELYIQNCPNSASSLDLSGCQALRTLDIRGSGFTGVAFAVGGLLEEAHLCSPASLSMRDLYYLTDENFDAESFAGLTTLRFENTDGVDVEAILSAAAGLSRVRLVGIEWQLATTALLNRMLALMGLDESDHNTDVSVLAGSAYISGAIRNREIADYAVAWPNLDVTYDPQNLVTQYVVTFANADGSTLYTAYVDRGSVPEDPVTAGLIDTPVKAADAQYTYTYTGWDDVESPILADKTITAQYSESVRSYTVRWYARVGLLLETQTVQYGEEAVYSGGIPTNTEEESSYVYNMFAGWDKSTGCVTGDTDVYAVWERAELPAAGKDCSQMTRAEIFAVAQAGLASTYFEDKDYFDMHMGWDFAFSNVEARTILENRFFDGTQYYDTGIKLFDAEAPDFTLAMEFEYLDTTENSGTLISCFEETGSEGFRIRYSNNPVLQWGDREQRVGTADGRHIAVIRHKAGSSRLFIYCSDISAANNYDLEITAAELIRTRNTEFDGVLSFGAVRFAADGGHDYYGKGWIHWCKIWYADLGADVSRKLAAWIHEPIRMEFAGADRYRLAGTTSVKANTSWLANNMLIRLRQMNATSTNVGGWEEAALREMLNDRVFNGMDYGWQAMIKQVKIPASAGNRSSEIIVSNDKIYLAATREIGGYSGSPYDSEGSTISWFTSNAARIKFNGIIRHDDAQVISSDTDPTQLTGYSVKEGDIWINTANSSYGFIYIPEETKEKHTTIGCRKVSSGDNIVAGDGGLWLRAWVWWLRSPYASYATYFCIVSVSGNATNTYAAYSYGLALGFSI